ncbi:immunoglobulin-like domain-containing protein [Cohnella soli]|uniref:Immunoglobulin-like domain-containing protein n=1 Tax=Cohnella soli TaxID=425005 RepID=A0ABW0I2E2_9BACL
MFTREAKRWVATATVLTLIVGGGLPFKKVEAGAGPKVIDILQIPDFHGKLIDDENHPIAAVMGKNIEELKNNNPAGTLVLGGGDNYAGRYVPEISELTRGAAVMRVFNAFGMEASTVGNHEFDWGLETIYKNVPAQYPLLAANIYSRATGKRVFEPYKIFKKDGVKIAIVGAATEDYTQYEVPGTIDAYELKDIASEVNAAAADARAKGAEIVVANIHEEHDTDTNGRIFDAVAGLKGVDAVLGAHAHRDLNTTAKDANGNNIPLLIGRDRGQNIVHMQITVAADKSLSFANEQIPIKTESGVFPYGWLAAQPVISTNVQAIIDDELADIAAAKADKIAIDLGPVSEVTKNIKLPSKGANGSKIQWISSNPNVIENNGHVRRPAKGSEDVTLTLTAMVTKGDATVTQSFSVTVKPKGVKVDQ